MKNQLSQTSKWQNPGLILKKEMLEYNWQYRHKICSKCSKEQQKQLQCHKVDRFVNGIQETHCKKLIRARTKKFKKKIDSLLEINPLCYRN